MLIPVPAASLKAVLAQTNAPERPATPQGAISPQPRLVHAAHEFEAQLMKELLQPLMAADGEEEGGGSSGVLGEFAGEALGGGLSARGGFGIADRLIAQLSDGNAETNKPEAPQAHLGRAGNRNE